MKKYHHSVKSTVKFCVSLFFFAILFCGFCCANDVAVDENTSPDEKNAIKIATNPDIPAEAHKLVDLSKKAIDAKDYAKALDLHEKAFELMPRDEATLVREIMFRAAILHSDGKQGKAFNELVGILPQFKKSLERTAVLIGISDLLMRMELFPKAFETTSMAILLIANDIKRIEKDGQSKEAGREEYMKLLPLFIYLLDIRSRAALGLGKVEIFWQDREQMISLMKSFADVQLQTVAQLRTFMYLQAMILEKQNKQLKAAHTIKLELNNTQPPALVKNNDGSNEYDISFSCSTKFILYDENGEKTEELNSK